MSFFYNENSASPKDLKLVENGLKLSHSSLGVPIDRPQSLGLENEVQFKDFKKPNIFTLVVQCRG